MRLPVVKWLSVLLVACAREQPSQPSVTIENVPAASSASAPIESATASANLATSSSAGATTTAPTDALGGIVTTTPIPNAERTVATLRTGFRSCYNKGLAANPTMSGRIVMAIKVSTTGDVIDAKKVGGTGLDSVVEECILRKAKSATFEPPAAEATLQLPLTFVKSSATPSASASGSARPFDPFAPRR